ncbi:MAG: hypothetical protein ABI600_14820, partial [Luteolibacter sp.]
SPVPSPPSPVLRLPSPSSMPFHLVSYATTNYRHRQILLAASGLANGVVATATSWTLPKLQHSEFPHLAPDISLTERGSGFWAWKPFIIQQALDAVPDGEIVFYCDVGRKYPYILLDHHLTPFVKWMDDHKQDIMPGVNIPWNGSMEIWTKRAAFTGTDMDRPEIHEASPIQASFSLWRASQKSKAFVAEWLSFCVQRQLVSDEPSKTSFPESPRFRGHRHDQSLLTLCCLKHGIRGIDLGNEMPAFNERDPGQISEYLANTQALATFKGSLIRHLAKPIQTVEQKLRERIAFGKKYE